MMSSQSRFYGLGLVRHAPFTDALDETVDLLRRVHGVQTYPDPLLPARDGRVRYGSHKQSPLAEESG